MYPQQYDYLSHQHTSQIEPAPASVERKAMKLPTVMIPSMSLLVVLAASFSPSFGFQVRVPSSQRNDLTQVISPLTQPRSRIRLNESSTSTSTAIRERLGLEDRFGRWRWLQKLLDEEAKEDDVNRIIFIVLDSYLKFPRPTYGSTTETGSPELTVDRRQMIEQILEGCSLGTVPALGGDDDGAQSREDMLRQLEPLLPDPIEDEDGFKGNWDTVMELNGRGSVQINERNGEAGWKAVCLVSRVIIYYDFLTYGLVDAPLQ
jgi:hypothetical protein